MILSKAKKQKLVNILSANQIIFNAYDKLDDKAKIDSFETFCSNTASALFILGGSELVESASEYVFTRGK